jgi:hypothetical protein
MTALRCTAPVIVVILFAACIYTYIGNGPGWIAAVHAQSDLCKTNWWATILYINNFYQELMIVNIIETFLARTKNSFPVRAYFMVPLS